MGKRRRKLRFEIIFLLSLMSYGLFFLIFGGTQHNKTPKIIYVNAPNFQAHRSFDQRPRRKHNATRTFRTTANIGIVEGNVKEQLEKSKGALWELSSVIPPWMKAYFYWHRKQRRLITKENWQNFRYYLIRCTPDYNKCGGTADRLGPLPLHILIANESQRLLMIKWTTPTALENFLLPPENGIDWRVPDFLWSNLERITVPTGTFLKRLRNLSRKNTTLVRVKYQAHDHGSSFYNMSVPISDPSFLEVYHDVFRIFFTPTPPIANEVEKQVKLLGIRPGKFLASHLRAFYGVENRSEDLVRYYSRNTIRCALRELFPSAKLPILFVSESSFAVEEAIKYGKETGVPVLARRHTTDHLHLEKANISDPSRLYETFIDLYMLGLSTGVAYTQGGFGRWGNNIGYNATNFFVGETALELCKLPDSFSKYSFNAANGNNEEPSLAFPLFLPPMETY